MKVLQFKLRFEKQELPVLISFYSYDHRDRMKEIGEATRARGYMTYEEFIEMCEWKTVRSKSRVNRNSPELVEEATQVCLSADHDQLRIGSLLSLHGVQYPTASVILHFCHPEPYPILDFRALWSLGIEKPPAYNFTVWKQYVDYTRSLASKVGCSIGELDQALWQYSKDNQPPA